MAVYISNNLQGLEFLKGEDLSIYLQGYKEGLKTIGIINLMPKKSETESQILRVLSKGNEDLNVEFIRIESYISTNTSYEYMINNYSTFNEVKGKLDGVIITGAPLEKMEFSQVSYIDELRGILDYVRKNMKSSLYICWGAQVALNHFYGIRKELKENKIFGVFSHEVLNEDEILNGIENGFKSPHSRHTALNRGDLNNSLDLKIICVTEENEEHIIRGSFNDFYILGHCEYDENTLKNEYLRDLNSGLPINLPKNYFQDNNPDNNINFNWRDSGIKIYSNWIKTINA